MTVASASARWPLKRAALYLVVATIGHLVWETTHVRLYTIWWTGTAREIVIAVVHCSGGDVLISTATLLIAAIMTWLCDWHLFGSRMVLITFAVGIAYTVLSEWLNVAVLRSWSYSSAMPVLPWFGTGVSPLLQWLVIPAVAFVSVRLIAEPQTERRSATRVI